MLKLKQNKGITLIALVITIIVMLILVAVTINMAVNGGLFGYAGNAVSQTKTARDEEQNYTKIESGLTTDQLIEKYTTESITNPYAGETPAYSWTCIRGTWSEGVNEAGDVIAKAYEKETVIIDGKNERHYHLVIEKGNGTGEMGELHAVENQNKNYKIALNNLIYLDSRVLWLAVMPGLIDAPIVEPDLPDPGSDDPDDSIESYAWKQTNINITKVIICDGVENIVDGAFSRCTSLTSVTISSSVTTIGGAAFNKCTSLTNITIPSSVTTIGESAFFMVPHITYNGTAEGSPWGATSIN